jgi:hypothetical protein
MNRSQPRKMSSLPAAETKAVSEAKAAAALAALTSSDGDELPLLR